MSSFTHTDETAGSGEKPAVGSYAVGLVFFISGMPALIYQLIWQRALFTMYGINVEAVTVVVAGFLLGLGFGSLAGGYVSRRSSLNLLAVFGVVELVIGGFGLVSLRVVELVGRETLDLSTGMLTLVTLTLLFVPTLFMGSTLPILTAYLVRRSRNVGRSVGLLYCVNTVGSAAACFGSALFLMRVAGMHGAVMLGASINFAVGAIALAEAWRSRDREIKRFERASVATVDDTITRGTLELVSAIVLAALVGYVSLSYEIVWFRAFSIASNTSPAFALILGAYLAGIANGSLRVRRSLDDALPQGRAADIVAVALLVSSILGFVMLPATAYSATTSLGYFYPMLLLVFLQTTICGTVFPIICHYGVTPNALAGSRVSWIYIANILGAVAGTLVTGFVLMNWLSIGDISAILGALGVGIALFVAVIGPLPRQRRHAIVAFGAVALVAIAATSGVLFKGFYERLLASNVVAGNTRFVDVVENRSGVITVDPELHVYGSGAYDGRIAVDLMKDENLLIRPFALSLYHAKPETVLMVGLATGAWAQVIANHPSVKHLTIVEINPGYLEIIRKYPEVASLLDNPKIDIVIDDGRRWLNRHPERRFDAIIQNTTWYYRPNVTNLLSVEYLELMKAHLADGGIVMYNTTGSLRVQRTACVTFSHGYREINMMAVSPTAMTLDRERLRATLTGYRIDGKPVLDLADAKGRERLEQIISWLAPPPADVSRPAELMEQCGGIIARSGGLPLITDDNMGEEWAALLSTDPLLMSLRRFTGR